MAFELSPEVQKTIFEKMRESVERAKKIASANPTGVKRPEEKDVPKSKGQQVKAEEKNPGQTEKGKQALALAPSVSNRTATSSQITRHILETRPLKIADPVILPILKKEEGPSTGEERPSVGSKIPTQPLNIEKPEFKSLGLKLVDRENIPNVGFLNVAGIGEKVWSDEILLHMPGLRLKTYGTSELVNISRDFWRTLSQEVSSRSVGYLLLLAWNIRSPTTQGETVYTTDMYFRTGNDIQIDHLSDKVIATGTKELPDLKGIANEDLVKCSCYIAASLLRLFTKMPGTWELAYVKHLKEGYFKFYKEPYPILNFSPDGNCIEGICQTLQNVTIMKGTLGRFLYSYYYLEDGKGLCTMLFEQHIGLTGMHAFNLFLRVAISMNVTAKELTLACWHRMTKIPLGAIMDILSGPASEIGKAKSPNERGTWRYSRLFGNEYFMSIQSKHCGVLICTLAILCELMGQAGNQDIHKIASISRIPDEAKEQYRTWATRIHHFFTSSDDAAENNPFTKIVN